MIRTSAGTFKPPNTTSTTTQTKNIRQKFMIWGDVAGVGEHRAIGVDFDDD